MPKGVRGFQPGRKKTGGRVKDELNKQRQSNKFITQLKGYGFNYPRELANVLLDIKKISRSGIEPGDDAKKILNRYNELKLYYAELKLLLPYMAPKLREKEVETSDDVPTAAPAAPISDEALLSALDPDGQKAPDTKGTSNPAPVGAGNPELLVQAGSEDHIPDLAGEQEAD